MAKANCFILLCLWCLSFLWLNTPVWGQANFRYLNKKDGLSQASVFSIAQDSTGFLWFGTRDGLNRYDGNMFRVYRQERDQKGLAGNDVRALYTDPLTKHLWVGTLAGLSRYEADEDRFVSYFSDQTERTLWDNVIRAIFRDNSGRLWVGTYRGLNRYHPANDNFQQVNLLTRSGEDDRLDVAFITEDNDGNVYAGTEKGLFILKAGATTWVREPSLSGQHFTCGQFDAEGNLWLGTSSNGVVRWHPKTAAVKEYKNVPAAPGSLSNNRIRALVINSRGDLWVGTFEGLNLLAYGADSFTRFTDSSKGQGPLLHNSIRSLLIDRSDKLWCGTYYGGIHHFDERYNYFTNYQSDPFDNSLNTNVVGAFAQEADGDLWVGTEGGGLNFLDPESGAFSTYQWRVGEQNPVSANNIKALLMDDDILWVGTYRAGLTRFDTKTKARLHYGTDTRSGPVLTSDNVYGLLRERDLLWILTYGGGLNVLDLTSNKMTYFQHEDQGVSSISSDNTRTILRRNGGGYWIGTDFGLNRVTVDETGMPTQFTPYLAEEKVYALAPAKGGVWVGTFSGGLFRCDDEGAVIRRYTTADGLPDNSVFGILETAGGILWLSTGSGLSRFEPDTEVFNNFNETNGLINLEFNFNAAFKTQEGDFLFGGINGFTRFDPMAFSPNLNIPPVVFTRLLRNNQEVAIGEDAGVLNHSLNATTELVFAYDEADFTIEFAALDYFSAGNNHYAYMLEGLDRDWNYSTGETQASYTIQREGEYTFRLLGANSDGVWNPNERQISVVVLPPPWRSWWAYLIYLTLIGLTVFALIRFLRLRHKVQLQEVAKQQQDELMEMKLRFFTNITHEFRTPLTLILGPLEQLLNKTNPKEEVGRQLGLINRNAQRLLNLVNQVLTFRRLATDHEPLRVSECLLTEFMDDVYASFEGVAEIRGIEYQLVHEVDDLYLWCDQSKLEKVFFNLLSNAFKFTPDGGEITVGTARLGEDRVKIWVRDTGIGIPKELHPEVFKRFYEKSVGKQSNIKSSGIGLAVSRKMVELHGGDIYIEECTPPGAKFVVELKLGQEHFSEVVTEFDAPVKEEPQLPGFVEEELMGINTVSETTGGQTILVVDDNEDVRTYVASIFSPQYHVLQATTGKHGLTVARQSLPALVISDVMMPEMDGMAFCHALKNDLEISHIPVILLTARSGQPFKLKGLRTGADDYVTKPFNPEELILRVANMLSNRQRFKDSFQTTLAVEPSRVEVTSIDEEFLLRVLKIAEEHVHDPGYKVEHFARELAVSRTLLFNKLKALTGQTPSKFLKNFRMKRAAQLLADSDYRISKIAEMVGFRDDRYFSECFKKQYGVAPGNYRKTQQES